MAWQCLARPVALLLAMSAVSYLSALFKSVRGLCQEGKCQSDHAGQCIPVRNGPVMGMPVRDGAVRDGTVSACRSGLLWPCHRVPPWLLLREHTENIIPVGRSSAVALYMGDGHGGQLQWSEPLQVSKVPAFLTLMGTGMHFVICSCSSEYGYCAIGVAFTCLQHRLLFRQQSLPEVYVSLLADREYLFRLVCAQA